MASGLDLRQLCILAGKTVWWLSVDALVLNDDGNVLTAISAATLAALRDTRVPKVGFGYAVRGREGEKGERVMLESRERGEEREQEEREQERSEGWGGTALGGKARDGARAGGVTVLGYA